MYSNLCLLICNWISLGTCPGGHIVSAPKGKDRNQVAKLMPKQNARTKLNKIRHLSHERIGRILISQGIVRGIDKQAQVITHGSDYCLPDPAFAFHFRKKVVIKVVNEPCILIQFALQLPGRPSGVSEKASQLNVWVLLAQGSRLFQVDAKIQLEGGRIVQPFPCSHD